MHFLLVGVISHIYNSLKVPHNVAHKWAWAHSFKSHPSFPSFKETHPVLEIDCSDRNEKWAGQVTRKWAVTMGGNNQEQLIWERYRKGSSPWASGVNHMLLHRWTWYIPITHELVHLWTWYQITPPRGHFRRMMAKSRQVLERASLVEWFTVGSVQEWGK